MRISGASLRHAGHAYEGLKATNEHSQLSGSTTNAATFLPSFLPYEGLKATVAVALWMGVSSLMVMIQKSAFETHGIHIPFFLSALGSASTSLVGGLLCLYQRRFIVPTRAYLLTQLLPLSVLGAVTLATGNIAFQHLSLSLIQILKAGTPALTLLVLYLRGMTHPSELTILAVALITLGTGTAAVVELRKPVVSLIGVAVMTVSNLAEALRVTTQQASATSVDFGTAPTLLYGSGLQAWFLFGASAVLELPPLRNLPWVKATADYVAPIPMKAQIALAARLCPPEPETPSIWGIVHGVGTYLHTYTNTILAVAMRWSRYGGLRQRPFQIAAAPSIQMMPRSNPMDAMDTVSLLVGSEDGAGLEQIALSEYILCPALHAFHPLQPVLDAPIFSLALVLTAGAVQVSALLAVAYAGSLTCKVWATVRNSFIFAIGVLWYHDAVTLVQTLGYLISTVGLGLYTYTASTTPTVRNQGKVKKE